MAGCVRVAYTNMFVTVSVVGAVTIFKENRFECLWNTLVPRSQHIVSYGLVELREDMLELIDEREALCQGTLLALAISINPSIPHSFRMKVLFSSMCILQYRRHFP